MFNLQTELFLGEYFLFRALAGKTVSDGGLVFDKLYDAFLLPPIDKRRLKELAHCTAVAGIDKYNDFARYCRLRQYNELCGLSGGVDSETNDMIVVKGNALKTAQALGAEEIGETTEAAMCKFITDAARNGIVAAIRVLGFLQCEGIYVPRDEASGIKRLEQAARWNSVEGIMLALFYNAKGRRNNIDRLYTVSAGGVYSEILESAKNAYGIEQPCLLDGNKLLGKAFGAGVLKPEVYVPQFARFIFSEVICSKDKERALFSGNKELAATVADLPLKLENGEIPCDGSRMSGIPFVREAEKSRIASALKENGARFQSTYKPVCICADSEYVLNLYMSAVKRMYDGAHVERIDVAELQPYDLEPTINNVFLRSCDEDRHNVYLLYIKGDVNDYAIGMVKAFLQTRKRGKFALQRPSAVVDLSAVLPVCFCDKDNARLLKSYCDVVDIAPATAEEKCGLVNNLLHDNEAMYGMRISADDAAVEMLVKRSVDSAAHIINNVARAKRGGSLVITPEHIRECVGDVGGANNKYGFGGFNNEDR